MFDNPDNFELKPPPPIDEIIEIGEVGLFFETLIDFLYAEFIYQGYSDKQANLAVSKLVCQLASAFAGQSFYVSSHPLVFTRQLQMINDLRYMQSYDVDKKYGMSRGYTMRLKHQFDALRNKRLQLGLDF